MRTVLAFVAVVSVLSAAPAAVTGGPKRTVSVDCAAPTGGDGSSHAPFDSISAAVSVARGLSAQYRVTVDVAAGTCDRETLPIRLDFPVRVQGARLPRFDPSGFPTGDQFRDTVVTWTPPAAIPAGLSFFEITAAGVELSRLSIDGRIPLGPNSSSQPSLVPIGVFAHVSTAFTVEQLRIVQVGTGVRVEGATGSIAGNYIGSLNSGLVLFGSASEVVPQIVCANNRVEEYRINGIALAGIAATATTTTGALGALVTRNDVVTSFTATGPSNPAALRISPSTGDATDGSINAIFLLNQVRGTPTYAIAIHGGQPRRRPDHRHYTGAMNLGFYGTVFDDLSRRSASIVTFTNIRAEALPCELNPANTQATCPSLSPTAPVFWEFLEHASVQVWHGGELNGAAIDHPVFDPYDGRQLDNQLTMNGQNVNASTPSPAALLSPGPQPRGVFRR